MNDAKVDEAHENVTKAIDDVLDDLKPDEQRELLGRLVDDLEIKLEEFGDDDDG